ncbi:C39 family peptidase [Dactylosporangium sp. AC04546]|uniref:C39 family peptidase n=1 Tax=Dactylosporangium sp. AC04546 TaxID=2862460 RepID=UPI001EE1516A|nr:C39 family peptidase [Dactylosporangium sp. AC04546]WVK80107.1 C39 family peptidase [Dactylosporangium sp. AC04546]
MSEFENLVEHLHDLIDIITGGDDDHHQDTVAEPLPDHPHDDDPAVVGEPAAAAEHWHMQERADTCAVASQEFILDELTGADHSEAQLTELAEAHGWYQPGGGTAMADVGNILEYFGVPVQREYGATFQDLQQALDGGQKVIVGVDSDEIWTPGHDPDEPLDAYPGIPGQGADHAVQVTGVDYSDPAHPVVVLNDPGTPDGGGERVALEAFLDAWEDSGNYLVTAGSGHA